MASIFVPVHYYGGWEWTFMPTVWRQVEEVTGYKIHVIRPEHDFT
jgi:hypothetical protein